MKRFNILLCAVFCTICAFAQSVANPILSGVIFSAPGQEVVDEEENIFELTNPEVTISMEFVDYNKQEAQALGYAPKLMIATGMGFGIDPNVYDLQSDDSTFSFTMDEEKWGTPYMGMLNAVLTVCFMNASEDLYITEEGDPVFYQAVYTAPNTFPTKFEYVYPNNDWSEETFDQAYANGLIRFNFSNEISLEEGALIGEISYTRFDGDDVNPVDIELGVNAEADWNPLDGFYTITINYALEDVAANELQEIEIYLDTLTSPYGDVDVEPVLLENETPNVKRIAKKAPASKGFAVSTENVSVYNIAGMLVKENIAPSEVNKLPKGLYIVNGKKVVVK